jgi:hypothetical protein
MAAMQFSLRSLLPYSAAAPLWAVVCLATFGAPGYGGSPLRYMAGPVALVGITLALARGLRGRRDAWALAALLAGVIALAALSFAAAMSLRFG